MTRAILAAAALLASPASACDITALPWETYATDVAIALDAGTTMDCVHRDICHEGNPLYGSRHPRDATLIGVGLGRIAINTGIACFLSDHAPRALPLFNHLSLAVNGGVAAANLRFTFK